MAIPTLQTFTGRAEMADAAAAHIGAALTQALAARGRAVLSVCGGSTPGPVYDRLSTADLDWEKITVILSDERWVDPASPDSNERMIRDRLLRRRAAPARFIGLKTRDSNPAAAEAALVETLDRYGPVDIGLLGVGEDGHTASLFPDAEGGEAALDPQGATPVKAVRVRGEAKGASDRMTLTLPALAAHRALLFAAQGQAKRAIVDSLAAGDEAAADWPAAKLIRAAAGPVQIYWAP